MEPTQARIELVREDGTIRMGGTDVSMEDMARMLGVFAGIVAGTYLGHGIRRRKQWNTNALQARAGSTSP